MLKNYVKILYMCISCFFGLLTVIFPVFILPFTIIASVSFAIVLVNEKQPYFLIGMTIFTFIAVLIFTSSVTTSFLAVFTFFPIGLSLGISYINKSNINKTVSLSFIFSIIGMLIIFIFFIFENSRGFSIEEAFTPIKSFLNTVFSAYFNVLSQNMDTSIIGNMTETDFAKQMTAVLLELSPALIAVYLGLFAIICSYWLLKFMLKKIGNDAKNMSVFTTLTISKTGAVLYFISLTLSLLFADNMLISSILYNITFIFSYVFAYSSLSLIGFYMNYKNFSPYIKIFVFITVIGFCILPFGLINILSVLGVSDSIYNLRKRITKGIEHL